MRADRLISMLLLLQNRGKMTAFKLAELLEISERTVYRDVESLSATGVPIYTEKGPGGGIALLESYRTTLTGLTSEEARALFMLAVPAPLEQLGVSQNLNSALLKLSASLPAVQRRDEERTRQRFYLDAAWWSDQEDPAPYLHLVQQALWHDQMLNLSYRTLFDAVIEVTVNPMGLVAKASVWYLVFARENAYHVVRVSQILNAEILPETFTRPTDFDLPVFWLSWCTKTVSRPPFIAVVRVDPQLASDLPRYFGETIRRQLAQAEPDEQGWLELSLPFEHFFAARERILGFGRAVEVIAPLPLRESVLDFARQITNLYDIRAEER